MTKVTCLLALALLLAGCVVGPSPYGTAVAPASGNGGTCYAGAYVCPMATPTPIGSTCSCPGLGAPSFGTVR